MIPIWVCILVTVTISSFVAWATWTIVWRVHDVTQMGSIQYNNGKLSGIESVYHAIENLLKYPGVNEAVHVSLKDILEAVDAMYDKQSDIVDNMVRDQAER